MPNYIAGNCSMINIDCTLCIENNENKDPVYSPTGMRFTEIIIRISRVTYLHHRHKHSCISHNGECSTHQAALRIRTLFEYAKEVEN